jgi:hypothetical protein
MVVSHVCVKTWNLAEICGATDRPTLVTLFLLAFLGLSWPPLSQYFPMSAGRLAGLADGIAMNGQ